MNCTPDCPPTMLDPYCLYLLMVFVLIIKSGLQSWFTLGFEYLCTLSIIANLVLEVNDLLALNKCLLFFNCTVRTSLPSLDTIFWKILTGSSVIVLPSITGCNTFKVDSLTAGYIFLRCSIYPIKFTTSGRMLITYIT